MQPKTLKDAQALIQLKAWGPDLIVVAAFGQILRSEVLDLPPFGCINVHASLLPRWRGAAPIQAAIRHGDQQSGVSIMKMDTGIDTGPVLSQRMLDILPEETGSSLAPKLAQLGADLLIDTLPGYVRGEIHPHAQTGEATYAPMLKKSDGHLEFTQPAVELERKVRAFNPWPGTFMEFNDSRLKIHHAKVSQSKTGSHKPGSRVVVEGLPAVQTSAGSLVLLQVQPAGKKSMTGEVFLRGARDWTS